MASNTQNCRVPENKKKSCGWMWVVGRGALISRNISMKDVLRMGMYANDLAMIADKKQELQEVLEQWKGTFKNHGPIMSREKTEEMWV